MNAAMSTRLRQMGSDPATVENFKELDENDAKALSFAMLTSIPTFSMNVRNKQWILLESSSLNDIFYISDNPIGFHNYNNFAPYGNLGFAVPGIEIYFPLSPTLIFAMFCHSILDEARTHQASQNEAAIELLSKSVSGEPLKQHPDNMEFLNYIQVRFSYRHVYSSKNEFDLVERILNDHPDWKVGLMPEMA